MHTEKENFRGHDWIKHRVSHPEHQKCFCHWTVKPAHSYMMERKRSRRVMKRGEACVKTDESRAVGKRQVFEAFSFSALWLKQQSTVILSEGHPYINLTINTRLTDRLQLLLRRTYLSNAHIPCYVHKNMIKKKKKHLFWEDMGSTLLTYQSLLGIRWYSVWGNKWCKCIPSRIIAFGRIIKQSHYFIQFHCAIGK